MQIGIHSGLGNQLFQFAFAHASSVQLNVPFDIVFDQNPPRHRPIELSDLVLKCSHRRSISTIDFLDGNYWDKVITKLPFLPFNSKNLLKNAFAYTFTDVDLKKLNIGFFQNWRFVDISWPYIENEIWNYLDTFDAHISSVTSSSVIVHVRRGDLIENKNSMGLLDSEYYLKALEIARSDNQKIRVVVVTDDKENAFKITESIGADVVIGPQELSPWEALKLMSTSRYVIAANSTLSWWGAFLSMKRGGIVFLPDPWFKNWEREVIGDAFKFPGINLVSSCFEK